MSQMHDVVITLLQDILIVPIWKRKGDAQHQGNYIGTTLLSHIMTLLEMILDNKLCDRVENKLDDEQQGFTKGRRTIMERVAQR